MAVCLVYQHHTLRSQARALSLVEVLQGRGKPVVARHLAGGTDLRGTSYGLSILIDWHPEMPLEKDPGKIVYWDIPEDLRSHLHEPLYQHLIQQVDGFIATDIHHGRHLAGFKKEVRYLPSPIPTVFLQHHYSSKRDAGIGLFGHTDLMRSRHALSQVRERFPEIPIATDHQDLAKAYQPAIHTVADPLASIPLLSRTRAVLSPQVSGSNADPLWLLCALFLGKAVLINQDYDPGLSKPVEQVLTRVGDWGKHLQKVLDDPTILRRLHTLQPYLNKEYSAHALAHRWWKTIEAIQKQQLTRQMTTTVSSGMISGTSF